MLTYYEVGDTVIVDMPVSQFDGFIGEIVELSRLNCKVKLRGNDNFVASFPYDGLDRIDAQSEPEGLDMTGKRKAQRQLVKEQEKWNKTFCSYQSGKATRESIENGTWHIDNFEWDWRKIATVTIMTIGSLAAFVYYWQLAPIGILLTVAYVWFTKPKGVIEYITEQDKKNRLLKETDGKDN